MLIPTFKIQLGRPVLVGLTTVGRFDGKHPSIALATSSDNVIVHSPHVREEDDSHELKHLNVAQTICALSAGDLECDNEDMKGMSMLDIYICIYISLSFSV